jgi:hypothetical protein
MTEIKFTDKGIVLGPDALRYITNSRGQIIDTWTCWCQMCPGNPHICGDVI